MSDDGESLLSVEDLRAGYGETPVLHGVSMHVDRGEVVSLIGRNGAGKTTTLRSIVGVLQPSAGRIYLDGEDVTDRADYEKARSGIRYVPEDRQVFPDLTVEENLRVGAIDSADGIFTVEEVYQRFPRLRERRSQPASHLSGGEQQMLVIARALLGPTKLLLLDEPSEGLAPQIVRDVLDIVESIAARGVTILLVEQNVRAAMAVADRHYVINKGELVFEGTTEELDADEGVKERHLGVGATENAFD